MTFEKEWAKWARESKRDYLKKNGFWSRLLYTPWWVQGESSSDYRLMEVIAHLFYQKGMNAQLEIGDGKK
jgi:hypothetical protein